MAASQTERKSGCPRSQRALQAVIVGFFGAMLVVFVALYLIAPAIYVETLMLTPTASDTHPLAINLFFVAIVAFVATLGFGVIRRWRWLYWLLLLAFLASILELPGGILQLMGIIPVPQPTWYTVLRMAIGLVEFALGIWMLRVWRACGVWAQSARYGRGACAG